MEEPSEDSLSSLDKYMTRFQFLQPFLMVTRLEKLDCLLNDNKLFFYRKTVLLFGTVVIQK